MDILDSLYDQIVDDIKREDFVVPDKYKLK